MTIIFPCDKCGACCRHLEFFGKAYTWLLDGDTGMCRYFDPKSNLCCIYPIRPIICNLDVSYTLYFSHIPREEFIAMNREGCGRLKALSVSGSPHDTP